MKYQLKQLYFYHGQCNLLCKHCWLSPEIAKKSSNFEYLKLPLFQSIIEQAIPLGLKSIKLTGGEPLLHPEILKMLNFINKKKLSLSIETNGTLCTKKIAKAIKQNSNIFIAVSLDSTKPKIHEWIRNSKGSFNKTIKGINNLIQQGIKPQIIMTLAKKNVNTLEEVIYFSEKIGAASLKFNILQPSNRGKEMHKNNETLSIQELIEIGKKVENELSQKTTLPLFFDHPPAFRPLNRLFGKKGTGCHTCGIFGILSVLSNASYALCGIGTSMKEFIFGNAKENKLEDIWNNNNTLQFIRKSLPQKLEGVCKQCLMNKQCMGSCIAQNYYSTKNLMAPFWFCEEAFQNNLFPKTRLK